MSAAKGAGSLLLASPSLDEVVRAAGTRRRAARGVASRKRATARRADKRPN